MVFFSLQNSRDHKEFILEKKKIGFKARQGADKKKIKKEFVIGMLFTTTKNNTK